MEKIPPSIQEPWSWPTFFSAPTLSQKQWLQILQLNAQLFHGQTHFHCDPGPCGKRLLWEIKRSGWLIPTTAKKAQNIVHLRFSTSREKWMGWIPKDTLLLHASLQSGVNSPLQTKPLVSQHRYKKHHWMTLLPPLAAIFFALLTRRILLSLFLSLLLGSILHHTSFWIGIKNTFGIYLWEKALYKEFSFNIILFTLSLIGMINVCTRNGGVRGLIDKLVRYATTPRSSRLITALLGLLVFFDDYANTIMVGNTMRPLTDRYRVSREKLAYLVDSTAAPIAAIALLSTWIGYEVGLLSDISASLGLATSGYELFIASLPFRFYCWMTLIFVFIGIFLDRDYGPMYHAEMRASLEGKLLRDGAQPMVDMDMKKLEPSPEIVYHWRNALVPIGVVFFSGFFGLLYVGGFFHGNSAYEAIKIASFNSSRIFLYASLFGSIVAILMSVFQKLLTLKEAILTWLAGARAMVFAVGILLFAWSMSALAKDLGTAYYLIAILEGSLRPEYLPLLVFFMAAAVSFSTGTSWGTMGILLPTIGPLAYIMGGSATLVLSVGAVLDGSIFGDHCSPLSDTTLFSSAATSCDHIDHVRTQAPYAITVMLVAAIMGYLFVSFGGSVLFSLLMCIVMFTLVFVLFGKKIPPSTKER